MENPKKLQCFIIGAKSIGQYGGYETFVMKLLEYNQSNKQIQFHVACKSNGDGHMDINRLQGAERISEDEFKYCNARIFMLHVPEKLGAAQAIYYDIAALKECCRYIKRNQIENAVVYVLTCRIGPFVQKYMRKLRSLGARLYLNPDGHEWKRAKWSAPVRKYWKESERLMVKAADLVICDSIHIEKYIQKEYAKYQPKTTYIAYGADITPSNLTDDDPRYIKWLEKHNLKDKHFYISVGRFVPENNFETMIREFMRSKTAKDFVIITTENKILLEKLERELHFSKDKRIKFVGTVYDQELLKKIRENAFGYFHGHTVGGTNPSLLEALGSTRLNLLYKIGFNEEVAMDAALYWTLEEGNLSRLIDANDNLQIRDIEVLGNKAKQRIAECYSWKFIADRYSTVFCIDLDGKKPKTAGDIQ